MKNNSRQIRISRNQYEILNKLSEKLNTSRKEILNNAVSLIQFLVENKSKSAKISIADGTEKEMFLSGLMSLDEKSND